MCGRISRHHAPWELSERFDAKQLSIKMEDLEPRYNTAPTETVPIVVLDREGERKLTGAKWGLVPRWAKDPSIGNRLINARAEGAAEKPAFKWALEHRRCLVPACGFYEWIKAADGGRQPFHIRRKDGGLFALAGVWEVWKPPEGEALRSFTVFTTRASPLMVPIHDRMPVILPREAEAAWLEKGDLALLAPYVQDDLEAVPVSRRVNKAGEEGADLIERVALAASGAGAMV